VERSSQRLAPVLNSEINQRRSAAECGRARAGLEVVSAGSSAERHVEMRVDVNSSRHHVLALGIEHSRCIFLWQALADGVNLAVDNCYVRHVSVSRGDDASVLNETIKCHLVSTALPVSGRTNLEPQISRG